MSDKTKEAIASLGVDISSATRECLADVRPDPWNVTSNGQILQALLGRISELEADVDRLHQVVEDHKKRGRNIRNNANKKYQTVDEMQFYVDQLEAKLVATASDHESAVNRVAELEHDMDLHRSLAEHYGDLIDKTIGPLTSEGDRRGKSSPLLLVEMRDRIAKLPKLESIVDKLPKTADGEPIVPGMFVYGPADHELHGTPRHDLDDGLRRIQAVCNIEACGVEGGEKSAMNCNDDWEDASTLYSTREAAEAASANEG